jgi:hypothetical protein
MAIEVSIPSGSVIHTDGDSLSVNETGCLLIRGIIPDTHDSRPPIIAVYASGCWIRGAITDTVLAPV